MTVATNQHTQTTSSGRLVVLFVVVIGKNRALVRRGLLIYDIAMSCGKSKQQLARTDSQAFSSQMISDEINEWKIEEVK